MVSYIKLLQIARLGEKRKQRCVTWLDIGRLCITVERKYTVFPCRNKKFIMVLLLLLMPKYRIMKNIILRTKWN